MPLRVYFFLLAMVLGDISGPVYADSSSLAVLPGDFTLFGPGARQKLIVEEVRDDRYFGPTVGEVEFQSSDEKIVRLPKAPRNFTFNERDMSTQPRTSGVLAPIFSLPGARDLGAFGAPVALERDILHVGPTTAPPLDLATLLLVQLARLGPQTFGAELARGD